MVEVGPPLHRQHAQRGAPRLAEQVDLLLVETLPQILRHLDGVGDRLSSVRVGWGPAPHTTCRCRAGPSPRRSCPAPTQRRRRAERQAALARPAAEVEQHRFVDAVPTDHDPLSWPPMRTVVSSAMLPGSGRPSAARMGGVRAGQRMATASAISASPASAAGVQPNGLPGQAGWPDRWRAQRTPSSRPESWAAAPPDRRSRAPGSAPGCHRSRRGGSRRPSALPAAAGQLDREHVTSGASSSAQRERMARPAVKPTTMPASSTTWPGLRWPGHEA